MGWVTDEVLSLYPNYSKCIQAQRHHGPYMIGLRLKIFIRGPLTSNTLHWVPLPPQHIFPFLIYTSFFSYIVYIHVFGHLFLRIQNIHSAQNVLYSLFFLPSALSSKPSPLSTLNCGHPPPPPFSITVSASFFTRLLCPTHPTSAHFCLPLS